MNSVGLEAKCPECAMDIPAQAKSCMFCGCIFSDKERKELIRLASLNAARKQKAIQRTKEAVQRGIEASVKDGKITGILISIFLSPLAALIALIAWSIISLLANSESQRAFARGLWKGSLLVILFYFVTGALCGVGALLWFCFGPLPALSIVGFIIVAAVLYFSKPKARPSKVNVRKPVRFAYRKA